MASRHSLIKETTLPRHVGHLRESRNEIRVRGRVLRKKGYKPLYASELAELTRRAIGKTRELGELISTIDPKYDPQPNKAFWFSTEPEQLQDQVTI
jgi:hypothetical protein